MAADDEEQGVLGALFGCCCGASGTGEELYKDWESHPACQQYAILKRLGEGGFSEVHMAQDKLTGKTVALKVVFLNVGGLTKEQKKILTGEARLVRMVAHPNIVRCMQVLETRRQQVLVLEYLSGGEMLRQLQAMKRYSEANACQMFKQIADAVAYLHSLGILHRDIKPENCLLAKPAAHYATKNKPAKVKLIDLGMAGLYRPSKPMHSCMGSPGFIAPEVILGEAHTPAMDVYSMGVLLFVMLVGRKPWDAQRSHTLAYAVQPTREAPGLRDPVFGALSAPAKQLLAWMLCEDPSRRPSMQQVLGHSWVLQGGVNKAEAGTSSAAGAAEVAPSRVYQQVVQQRLQVLARSRDIMGTARGMMVLHGSGSRSQAVMFHKAVKAARLQLQQQAAVLQAAGQMPAGADLAQAAAATAASLSQQQQDQQGHEAAALSGGQQLDATAAVQQLDAGSPAPGSSAASAASAAAAGAVVGANSPQARLPGLARSSAPVLSPSQQSRVLPRPASSTALAAAAAAAAAAPSSPEDAAPGEPAASRAYKSVTVGQLACDDLNRRRSLLLGALQQPQPQQPVLPPPPQQQPGRGGRGVDAAGSTPAGGPGQRRRMFASEGGAWFGPEGSQGLGAAGAASSAAAAAAAAAVAGAQPITIDVQQLALVDALERGMSAPNTEFMPFSPPARGARAVVGMRRADRAVSTSPGALALLDAEDQLCLLQAVGTSVEQDEATLLGGNVLSWGRRGAADMVASFRDNYHPMKPIARSFARLGQSLSRSFGRSSTGRSPAGIRSPASGRYLEAAAAAAATQAHTGVASRECSVSALTVAASTLSFTQQGPVSPTAATAPPPAGEAVSEGEVSFMVTRSDPVSPAAAPAEQPQPQQQQETLAAPEQPPPQQPPQQPPAAASLAAARCAIPAGVRLRGKRSSEDSSLGHQASTEHSAAFLGGQMSLDTNFTHSAWGDALEARSLSSSLLDPLVSPKAAAAAEAARRAAAAAEPRAAGWLPLRLPEAAAAGAGVARISVGRPSDSLARASPPAEGLARVSAASSGSGPAASAFLSAAGAAAAAAAVRADGTTQGSSGPKPAAAAHPGVQPGSSLGGPFAAARHSPGARQAGPAALVSPSVRAAATAAAARAEEEGIGLPNGLWLQKSQSIKSSTVASILQLLTPTKSPTGGSAAATPGTGQGADSSPPGGLGSAGGSVELAAAGSRTFSGSLLSPQADAGAATSPSAAAADELPGSAADAAGASTAAAEYHSQEGAAGSEGSGAAGKGRASSPISHTRDISMMSWLPQDEGASLAALQDAAGTAAADPVHSAGGAAAGDVWQHSSAGGKGHVVSPAKDITAAAVQQGGSQQAAAAVVGSQSSRAVSVPRSGAAAAARSRHRQLWPAPRHAKPHRTSSGGGADAPAAAESPSGAAAAAAAAAAGSSVLARTLSVADSSVEQEFYVGSFWSPVALASRAEAARVVQDHISQSGEDREQQLGRSTSSMGGLGSLQDDSLLPGGSLSTAAVELGFADAGASLPGQEGLASPASVDQPEASAARPCSGGSSSGAAGARCSGGGVVERRGRVSAGGGEGFLAAGSGDAWEGHVHGLHNGDGASVLVRVHSGAAGVESSASSAAGKAATAAGGSQVVGAGAGISAVAAAGGRVSVSTASAGVASTAAAVAAAEPARPYKWIAKAVVSRDTEQVQQQQRQPQFDAFDEPHGQWYYAGT